MSDHLLKVLLDWRAALHSRNLPAPPEADLVLIASNVRQWPRERLDPVTTSWKPTIEHLQVQVRFGVKEPLDHMEDALWLRPAQLQPTDSSVGAPSDAVTGVSPAQERLARVEAVIKEVQIDSPDVGKIRPDRLKAIANAKPAALPRILAQLGLARHEARLRAAVTGDDETPPAVSATPRRSTPPPSAPPPSASPPPTVARPDPIPASAGVESGTTRMPAVGSTRTPLPDVDPDGFAPYDFSSAGSEPSPLTVRVTQGKGLVITWREPEDAEEVIVYRVIAADGEPPWSPEDGRLVSITGTTDAQDDAPFDGAVRYVQVWANTGPDVRGAQLAQPRCIAEKAVVCPVMDVVIRETPGSVTGEWRVAEGISAVRVYRVPAGKAQQGALSPLYRICADENNLGGFQDVDFEPGKKYLYQFVAEIAVDDTALTSMPENRSWTTQVELRPVTDLTLQLSDEHDGRVFDVSWTPPGHGQVYVYCSAEPPAPGIEDEVRLLEQLAAARLAEDDRLWNVRVGVRPGRDGMLAQPWPPGSARAYVTPVTVHDGKALVGKTVSVTRMPAITDAVLIERVDEQLLTLSWPPGAAAVRCHVVGRNLPITPDQLQERDPAYTLDRDTWDTQGGLHITPPLNRDGCTLHLVAVAYGGAATFYGKPYPVDYPGLRLVRYGVVVKRNKLTLSMRTETPQRMPQIQFALVCNRDRFPLDIGDGVPVPLAAPNAQAASTVEPIWTSSGAASTEWTADVSVLKGYFFVRLFAQLPADKLSRVALLDPPIASLSLDRR